MNADEPQELTALQHRVVREIVGHARRDNLKAGDHLKESILAEQIGTSRTPVNVAMRYLVSIGVADHDRNRGFFLKRDAATLGDVARQVTAQPDDPLYLQIASDRLSRVLGEVNNEVDLMRRYSTSRAVLRRALSRIQQEGWVEKLVGHGWEFQPMIDSPQAYEESYVYRAALEPTGLLSTGFKAEPAGLAALRRRQQFIAEGGFETMTPIELFEANSEFHETLAKWSGNRFIHQAVRRTDQLRRLVEYRQAKDRKPRRGHALEHLEILDAIGVQDLLKAASLMRAHLENARHNKVYSAGVFPQR
jgi:DNA-binding GntR family transcriptional regulator